MTPQLNRITQQPTIMGGRACIRGMRVTVGMIVGQIGASRSIEEILADYPYLEREDIFQALLKFLIDMNPSPRWADCLDGAGFSAVHQKRRALNN